MKLTYTWLMYSFLCFGPEILCARKYDGSCSINAEDEFKCPNGVCIESSRVCDGRKDCSDGADETKASCDRYEYEIDITMDCGRVNAKNQGIIGKGMNKATAETTPWYVGIYGLNKTDSYYNLICGGSIIAPNLVISAAHCFWKKAMLSKKISITDGLYKVAVGKYDRNFTIIDNEFTQIINVETIHMKEGYYGANGFYAEDISIIVLQERVSFSNGVSPVCIDWNGKYNVVNGDKGKIVGWGKTEKGISSPILLEASLPYIDHSTCRNMYTNGFELFMTVDKFCAGSTLVSGQGVSKGDSGAGLCFLHSDSYYLTGVVSIKDPNTTNSIAVFTEVKYHIQWIRGLFNKHN